MAALPRQSPNHRDACSSITFAPSTSTSTALASQEAQLLVPLSTQGSISLTVTWEVEEEWVDEEAEARWMREHAEEDEDVLEEIFGRGQTYEDKVAAAKADGGAAKTEGPTSPKGAAAPPPKPPDMLSLSIAITILVKFILFDLVGFFQASLIVSLTYYTNSLTYLLPWSYMLAY